MRISHIYVYVHVLKGELLVCLPQYGEAVPQWLSHRGEVGNLIWSPRLHYPRPVLKASRIPGELRIFILLWNSEQVTSIISAGMLRLEDGWTCQWEPGPGGEKQFSSSTSFWAPTRMCCLIEGGFMDSDNLIRKVPHRSTQHLVF